MLTLLFFACSGAYQNQTLKDTSQPQTSSDDSGAIDDSGGDSGTVQMAGGPVINEVLAANEEGITDEEGKTEDWLELYNPTDQDLDLSGWALYDEAGREPWQLPEGTALYAGSWLVIWCDGDEDDGGLHAPFKLSEDGENVVLLNEEGDIVDAITFPPLSPDQSWGRIPDGSTAWTYTSEPSPHTANR
jgi:hypothetical protein